MNGILETTWGSLIGIGSASRVRLQVDLNLAFRGDIAGLRVIVEIGAGDTVIAAGIASIDGDRNIVQTGSPTLLELHRLVGLDFEPGAALLGFRNREASCGLL